MKKPKWTRLIPVEVVFKKKEPMVRYFPVTYSVSRTEFKIKELRKTLKRKRTN